MMTRQHHKPDRVPGAGGHPCHPCRRAQECTSRSSKDSRKRNQNSLSRAQSWRPKRTVFALGRTSPVAWARASPLRVHPLRRTSKGTRATQARRSHGMVRKRLRQTGGVLYPSQFGQGDTAAGTPQLHLRKQTRRVPPTWRLTMRTHLTSKASRIQAFVTTSNPDRTTSRRVQQKTNNTNSNQSKLWLKTYLFPYPRMLEPVTMVLQRSRAT